jgi:hypothetical protein
MAQFSTHAPISSSALRDKIKKEKLIDYPKPIGVIGKNDNYSFGYEGDGNYYVTMGILGELVCGRMKMTFEQAKQMFDALNFLGMPSSELNYKLCIKALKEARKNKMEGNNLFFFFVQNIREFSDTEH